MSVPKKAKFALIAVISLLTICAVLFVYDAAKGSVLSLWYSPKVTNHFKKDFDTVSSRLASDHGIVFDQRSRRKDCGPTSGYAGGGEYIFTCVISRRANPVIADEAFVKKWQETSPELEKYLLSHGWQKEWNKDQPIGEILDNLNNSGSVGVNYSKKHGGVTCRLSLVWIMPETPNHLTADEVCEVSQRTWGW